MAQSFGQLLRERRGTETCRAVAARAGISHAAVIHLESGKGSPNITTLRKLAVGLNVPAEYLAIVAVQSQGTE